MADRLTVFLVATALLTAGVLAWLVLGGGRPDPMADALKAAGVAVTVPEPGVAVRVVAPEGVLSEGIWSVGADRMRVRVTTDLDEAEGTRLGNEERSLLFSLFEDHQAPYPGALSNTLTCPDELRPAAITPAGSALFLLGLYANDRYAFGGCAEDLLRYRATVGAFYSAALRELVRVEYFEPKEAAPRGPDVLRSFRWVDP